MQLEGLPVEATAALTEDVVKNPQNSGVKNTNLV
jgi:hypothetical protein